MRTKRVQISPLASHHVGAIDQNLPEETAAGCLAPNPVRGVRQHAGGTDLRLFSPQHYEPGYAYPLVVWLHSDGDDASQLLRVMPEISLRNFVAVAPQGTDGNHHAGFVWPQTDEGIESAVASVVTAIDHARMRLNVAGHRIFLAGAGAGGTMAFRIGFALSQLVTGVISVNGPLPTGRAPLGDWRHCRKMPVLWAHLRDCSGFDEVTLCDQLKLLHVAGMDVELRQYPGKTELPATVLADANRWIMNKISSTIA